MSDTTRRSFLAMGAAVLATPALPFAPVEETIATIPNAVDVVLHPSVGPNGEKLIWFVRDSTDEKWVPLCELPTPPKGDTHD